MKANDFAMLGEIVMLHALALRTLAIGVSRGETQHLRGRPAEEICWELLKLAQAEYEDKELTQIVEGLIQEFLRG